MSNLRPDPALDEALDRFTVPPLSHGFTDRLVAAATSAAASLPGAVPARRGRRGGWARGHRVIIGAVAFGLMSAAAAATAVFGDVARTMPVIGPLIASIAPEKIEPRIASKKPKVVRDDNPPQQAALGDPPTLEVPPMAVEDRKELRREFVARKIAARLERRAEVREELGLPPRPVRSARVMPVLRRLPPTERAAIVERVREIRQEQRAALGGLPDPQPLLPDRAAIPAHNDQLPTVVADAEPATTDIEPQAGDGLRTPERLEQLRRLRAFRELQERRRELRRQRAQQ